MPDRAERQKELMKRSNFKCSCPACLKDYSLLSLPRRDPTYRHPGPAPSTIDGIMKELQKRFNYIQKNFNKYPSLELAHAEANAKSLIADIVWKSIWPFDMSNLA